GPVPTWQGQRSPRNRRHDADESGGQTDQISQHAQTFGGRFHGCFSGLSESCKTVWVPKENLARVRCGNIRKVPAADIGIPPTRGNRAEIATSFPRIFNRAVLPPFESASRYRNNWQSPATVKARIWRVPPAAASVMPRTATTGWPIRRHRRGSAQILAGGLTALFEDPLHGVSRQLSSIRQIELLLDVLAIGFDRLGAEAQPGGDLFGEHPLAD